ncbi:MAG: tetratricopeptide repeat protein [Gemmatimonadota bacterium]|nr:tetratricopeptide repeat protein [Gemmatimonadota bacterium]
MSRSRAFLQQALEHELGGRLPQAIEAYTSSIDAADSRHEAPLQAEALRRLASVRRRRNEIPESVELCQRSFEIATALGDPILASEALNGLAAVHLQQGNWDDARAYFKRALTMGLDSLDLRAKIEGNLGIMANIEGNFQAALGHYQRALDAYTEARSERGCAVTYLNLGMLSVDRQSWDDADAYFNATLRYADTAGDGLLRGHALINRAEVFVARGRYEDARRSAEEALRIFDQMGTRELKSDAYKMLGVIYRETGMPVLAEARFKAAVDLARDSGSPLSEAEAARELAVLYQGQGQNQEALRLLNAAHRLFGRVNAKRDLVETATKVQRLESVYLQMVRGWGRSIESTDSYTFGHSERVANYAFILGTAMGLDDIELTTLRMGAYLHDLGKIRVPHEILSKPGRLTPDEFDLMKMHPVYGLELLAAVEFPWNLKPIVRSHHEHYDGGGYPDRLRGDEIPTTAHLICAVDVYDALTTTRSYRGAMTHDEAIAEMHACKRWWNPALFEAFMTSPLSRQPAAADR